MSSSAQPPYASPPFDDPDADVIIRTSDLIDFRVYKVILGMVSPVFKDMFPMPQPKNDNHPTCHKDGVPVVTVTETAETMDNVLRIIHPMQEPRHLTTLEQVVPALEASDKYMMNQVQQALVKYLLSFAASAPLRVYAIACRLKLFGTAREAAKYTLQGPVYSLPSPMPRELDQLPTTAFFYALLQYHQRCSKTATGTISSWIQLLKGESLQQLVWFSSSHAKECAAGSTIKISDIFRIVPVEVPVRLWWEDYHRAAEDAVRDRIAGATVTEPKFLEPFLQRATACSTCRTRVLVQLPLYSSQLAKRIDDAISKVGPS
ncbi:hypothetical protein OBBRIDRAFT_266819 [Obba rivulosa]|uniref:BTB domain-containing protein n=1 Tax=Obba rivulosa TaxID=1052685 RepID=A0A8E2DQC6_9APHY|nr:hypothetical protein OBBRIDRAFT_266819 [Obba rivulosa]